MKEEKLLPSQPVKTRKRLQKVQAEVEQNTELELEEEIQRPSMLQKKEERKPIFDSCFCLEVTIFFRKFETLDGKPEALYP